MSASPRLSGRWLRFSGQAVSLSLGCGKICHGGYSKLLPCKQGLFEIIGVDENTLHIVQDGLENTISIHRATLRTTASRYCDDEPAGKEEGSSEEEPRLDRESDKNHKENDNIYIVDKIVRHIDSGPRLRI